MAVSTANQSKQPGRTNDPEGTKRNIIDVATREFANRGFSGARIDEIADKTQCSKRMIYYYFDNKEGLYLAVLENAYQTTRSFEAGLELDDLPPIEALTLLVESTFEHHNNNEDFIRLVMIENIHHARFLEQSSLIQDVNMPAISAISRILERGQEIGVFRNDVDPLELHWIISALCFFNVSNRATFSRIFRRDLSTTESLASLREGIVEMIGRHVLAQ